MDLIMMWLAGFIIGCYLAAKISKEHYTHRISQIYTDYCRDMAGLRDELRKTK